MQLWRVFPYDAAAKRGQPFSAACAPGRQGAGRFDIPDLTPVWYLAESPAHAVAEVVQGLRNQSLDSADLTRFGHPLALVPVTLEGAERFHGRRRHAPVLDLCTPAVLARYAIRPDALASWDATQTQRIARRLYGIKGCIGFRWWSALSGDWHSTILFHAKLSARSLRFGAPEPLGIETDAVIEAARQLAIALPRRAR